MAESPKPRFIVDSSPLITLSLFPVHKPAIEDVLAIAELIVAESVALETTRKLNQRDARVIKSLLDEKRMVRALVPVTTVDTFIDGYNIDEGERATIRLAVITPNVPVIIDDQAAFIAAIHFELPTIMLLDQIVRWVNMKQLERDKALKIVNAVATRYSEAFIAHTKYRLREV